MEGAVERVRPKLITVTAIIAGLLPILWGAGTGASVMKHIAAPMVGGMVSSTVLTLVVIPTVYSPWREWEMRRSPWTAPPADAEAAVRPGFSRRARDRRSPLADGAAAHVRSGSG
jgi:Cu(I)/Ag(I) efflux system membrane protein CusA/SilA